MTKCDLCSLQMIENGLSENVLVRNHVLEIHAQ